MRAHTQPNVLVSVFALQFSTELCTFCLSTSGELICLTNAPFEMFLHFVKCMGKRMHSYFCLPLSISSHSEVIPYFAMFCGVTFKRDLVFPLEPWSPVSSGSTDGLSCNRVTLVPAGGMRLSRGEGSLYEMLIH